MNTVILQQPPKIVFGNGCLGVLRDDYLKMGYKKLFLLTAPPIRPLIEETVSAWEKAGVKVEIFDQIMAEPTVTDFNGIVEKARSFGVDSVIGIGGGSVLDVTKLAATLFDGAQRAEDVFGTGVRPEERTVVRVRPHHGGNGQ